MLKLSVIVNMYNTAQYMDKCFDSLVCQDISLEEYEIIFVDDGSSDNSLEKANEYASQYPNVRICRHEINRGLAAGRNTGIEAAQGQFLQFVDPDDYVQKNSFGMLLSKMENEHLDVLRFNYQKVDESYKNIPDSYDEASFDYSSSIMTGKEFVAKRLGISCYVWAYIYRTEFLKQSGIRFVEGLYFDDTPWLPRVLQKAERLSCINVRHQYYLQRNGSLVHTDNKEAICKKVDGQIRLLKVLQKHCGDVDNLCVEWYNRIIAHLTISILTSASQIGWNYSHECLNIIMTLKIFPLCKTNLSNKTRRKILIFNLSPLLLLWLLCMKNRSL